jgi:hypothetical protein
MQQHECNKHNYLCINISLKILFPCKNQGVTVGPIGVGGRWAAWAGPKAQCHLLFIQEFSKLTRIEMVQRISSRARKF